MKKRRKKRVQTPAKAIQIKARRKASAGEVAGLLDCRVKFIRAHY
jgi:hypothetical protein